MKKHILLTVGIVLILNSIFLVTFYYLSRFSIVSSTDKKIALEKNEKIVKQNITKTYTVSNIQSEIISTIKKVSNSVVNIVITKDLEIYYITDPYAQEAYIERKKKKIGGGSGIIISKNGYILTNKHVVSEIDADYSVVTKNGDIYKVDKIRLDPILDLAVIKVTDEKGNPVYDLDAANIIDFSSNIEIGQFVLAIGNALAEYSNSVTLGILSAKGRVLDSYNGSLYIGLYQTDAAINPGNSGGPLINILGEVIGVNTAIASNGQGIGFSIPINKQFVNATIKSIEKYGDIKRPLLGIEILPLNKTIAKSMKLPSYKGVLIKKVLINSPAYRAGLQKGDIILEIDGKKIDENTPIIYAIFTHTIGEEVKLKILRDGKLITKTVKLTEF